MSKVKITMELEVNEQELKSMLSSQNQYKPLTTEEYIKGMEFSFEDGNITFENEIERYYNVNEGDSQCIKNALVTNIEIEK